MSMKSTESQTSMQVSVVNGTEKFGLGVIGLGIVGRRTIEHALAQGSFHIAGAWDIDELASQRLTGEQQHVPIAPSADAVIHNPATQVVYVATPPQYHKPYVLAALKAGKHVLCEKPLSVDVADSRAMVQAAIAATGLNAVNFVFASTAAGDYAALALQNGSLGKLVGAEIRLHLTQWPRSWQADATWLRYREQGGFTREVLSHYVYLTERLFGASRLVAASTSYPSDPQLCESHVIAKLVCNGIPVHVVAEVGGGEVDTVNFTLWGSKTSLRFVDWYRLQTNDGGGWVDALGGSEDLPALRQNAYSSQLAHLAQLLRGQPHSFPDFAAALSVQEKIEAILAAG